MSWYFLVVLNLKGDRKSMSARRRLIDADAFKQELKENYTFYGFTYLLDDFYVAIDEASTIETKQIKYYDEDEKVWKIGSVIVDE